MKTLKLYLRLNSLFSLFSGLSLIFFSEYFASLFHIGNSILFSIIGSGLVLFSIYVMIVSYNYLHNFKIVNTISVMDIIWALASFTIIAFDLFDISSNGNLLIGIIAIWISFLALMQIKYNRKKSE